MLAREAGRAKSTPLVFRGIISYEDAGDGTRGWGDVIVSKDAMHLNMHMKKRNRVVASDGIVNYALETCEQKEVQADEEDERKKNEGQES